MCLACVYSGIIAHDLLRTVLASHQNALLGPVDRKLGVHFGESSRAVCGESFFWRRSWRLVLGPVNPDPNIITLTLTWLLSHRVAVTHEVSQ